MSGGPVESDPCWLQLLPRGYVWSLAGCVRPLCPGISHWAYSRRQLKCLPPLTLTRGIKQPPGQSSLGMEGLNIGQLNKHHYDPHVTCLPGIKVTSMLLCVLLHNFGLQIKELQVRSWLPSGDL